VRATTFYEPFLLQALDSFSDWRWADLEPLGERTLGQTLALHELALHDHAVQFVVRTVAEPSALAGFMRSRRR
jgi:hypothetical protein